MANCNFKIPFDAAPKEVLATAKKTMEKYHGSFEGDVHSGHFRVPVGIGDIEGSYTITGHVMDITITKKPLIVTCSVIEKQLKKYMAPDVV